MEWEKELERRKLNVVIVNMKESEEREIEKRIKHDMEICIELFRNGLGIIDIKPERIDRIGRKMEGRVRPMLVKVKSEEERWQILKRNTKLRNNENYKRVFINKDMSREEREKDRRLRN